MKTTKKPKRLSDEDYKFIYSQVPRLCLDFVIKTEDGGLLLSKRSIAPYKGCWHFPGGQIYHRESIKDATKRILIAELGILPYSSPVIVGHIEYPHEGYRHSVSMAFELTISLAETFEIKTDPTQASAIKVFKKLPSRMIQAQRQLLDDIKINNDEFDDLLTQLSIKSEKLTKARKRIRELLKDMRERAFYARHQIHNV